MLCCVVLEKERVVAGPKNGSIVHLNLNLFLAFLLLGQQNYVVLQCC